MRLSMMVAQRTQCGVAPVLVDENIHYRMYKLAWSTPFRWWQVTRARQVSPPLFGVWHAYKYCVTQLMRKFHSVAWYAIRGTLPRDAHVPTSPSLRSYELSIAAVLQLPLHLRRTVTQMKEPWHSLHEADVLRLHVVGVHTGETPEARHVNTCLILLCGTFITRICG